MLSRHIQVPQRQMACAQWLGKKSAASQFARVKKDCNPNMNAIGYSVYTYKGGKGQEKLIQSDCCYLTGPEI